MSKSSNNIGILYFFTSSIPIAYPSSLSEKYSLNFFLSIPVFSGANSHNFSGESFIIVFILNSPTTFL